jgi:hypothetical protein
MNGIEKLSKKITEYITYNRISWSMKAELDTILQEIEQEHNAEIEELEKTITILHTHIIE